MCIKKTLSFQIQISCIEYTTTVTPNIDNIFDSNKKFCLYSELPLLFYKNTQWLPQLIYIVVIWQLWILRNAWKLIITSYNSHVGLVFLRIINSKQSVLLNDYNTL